MKANVTKLRHQVEKEKKKEVGLFVNHKMTVDDHWASKLNFG